LANDNKINNDPVAVTHPFINEEVVKEPEVFDTIVNETIEGQVVVGEISRPVEEEIAVIENRPDEIIAALPELQKNKPEAEQEKSDEPDFDISAEESTMTSEKGMAMLAAAKLKMDEPVAEDTPLFEALHTVDYFASQGIKLSQEALPKDKFGQQLKSFTEWLKAMKRIPQSEVVKVIGTIEPDKKVEELAEHSLDQAEIVTETMAEVWAKQGNKANAIEVYEKLSLQNPAKSHYFAGLIEQLRNN
jgi:hypothetical protein